MRIASACLLLPLLWVGGCASVGRFNGVHPGDDAIYVNGVTPVRQDRDYACGPACVAAVATHWGVSLADFRAVQPRQAPDATGHDLELLAGRLGLQAFAYEGSMDDLMENLGRGRPVIVMIPMPMMAQGGPVTAVILKAWNEFAPRPAHWVVVVGALPHRQIIINDPASGPLAVNEDKFRQWWAHEGNRCVLVAAPAAAKGAG
jgi:predicted double-glycine peptidase